MYVLLLVSHAYLSMPIYLLSIAPVSLWPYTHHRSTKDLLLFRSEAKDSRDDMLHWRNTLGVLEMAIHWCDSRNIWVLESLWARLQYFISSRPLMLMVHLLVGTSSPSF